MRTLLDQQQLQDPGIVADFILKQIHQHASEANTFTKVFSLTDDEQELLYRVDQRTYTGEPTSVQDLHELRILYWQVVGFLRG